MIEKRILRSLKHTHIRLNRHICLESLELSLSPLSFFKATQQLLFYFSLCSLSLLITETLTAPTQIQMWGFCAQELAITHIKWPTLNIDATAPKLRVFFVLLKGEVKNTKSCSLADYFIVVVNQLE
jgi:hypothetical protein